jgi:hypothetical protein
MGIGCSKKKANDGTEGTGRLYNVVVLGTGGVGKSARESFDLSAPAPLSAPPPSSVPQTSCCRWLD